MLLKLYPVKVKGELVTTTYYIGAQNPYQIKDEKGRDHTVLTPNCIRKEELIREVELMEKDLSRIRKYAEKIKMS